MNNRRRPRKRNPWRGIHMIALSFVLICALAVLSQSAFAQNTYVITDGDQVKTHITHTTDPATVLDEAGFQLDEDDTYTTELVDGVYEVIVQRTMNVTIDHCGEVLQVESSGETVAQLLARLNIAVDGDTRLSVSADTAVYDDMELAITRVVRLTEVYTTVLPFEEVRYDDPSLPAGVEAVLTEGRDGQVQCTASVLYEGGRELSRSVLNQTVLEQPVNRVVAVGTGVAQDIQEQGGLIIGDGFIITEDGQVLTYNDTMVVEATAYTHTDEGCDYWTSTLTHVRIGTVAVDPRLIPYGTRMFIVSNDGEVVYGISTAEDCGGDIKNKRIDLYYPTTWECFQFGRRDCTIYFLG